MDNKSNMEEFNRRIASWIDERKKKNGLPLSIEDINNSLTKIGKGQCTESAEPTGQFNGFSSEQISKMLYSPLEKGCPVLLRTLSEEEIAQIPIMRQALYLLNTLEEKEIKLTSAGYIPPKIVEELYKRGTKSWHSDYYKQKTEAKTQEVQVIRFVLKERGLIKIKTGTGIMALTPKGKKVLKDHNELMDSILRYLLILYNTGHMDKIEDYKIGNTGLLYSLWLLHHFGSDWRNIELYVKEYFKAFPSLLPESDIEFYINEAQHLYCSRVFEHLFLMIGFCDIKVEINKEDHTRMLEVRKTPIMDMMFSFEEPAKI